MERQKKNLKPDDRAYLQLLYRWYYARMSQSDHSPATMSMLYLSDIDDEMDHSLHFSYIRKIKNAGYIDFHRVGKDGGLIKFLQF